MSTTDRIAPRVVLLARRDTPARRDPNAPRVRRYRLARVQLEESSPATRAQRLARLRRTYD
ncbi:MAG TPA: hypothetical protein VLB47_08840 [Solirubrobacteraceae bacterium]|nr:hypothetical protein [Solirubrobacteraceae bacterium]